MKLGEMLVRDGRLSADQLTQVLSQQGKGGGRLGTVLVEHGLIDLDALTVYLGLELGLPIATGAMLERAKRSAVRLLTPEQAFRAKCVPLVVQDRQLIAAVEDPHDLDALDAVTRITGHRVVPRIAPEIRIYYYVERYYGIQRPNRFLSFGEKARGDHAVDKSQLPAAPAPGLPPLASQPTRPATPVPHLRRKGTGGLRPPVFDSAGEALEVEAEDLLIEMSSDDARAETASTVGAASQEVPKRTAISESYPPMNADAAIKVMETATERRDIASALMAFAAHLFDAAVLFVVRDNLAMGWKGTGSFGAPDRVECLLVPLDAPSLIQAAVRSDDHIFHGEPAPSTVNSYLFRAMRTPEPPRVAAAAVTIGVRVINVLYGHRAARGELDAAEIESLRRLAKAAADAYLRLIANNRQRRDSEMG